VIEEYCSAALRQAIFSCLIQEARSTSWTVIVVWNYINIAGAASKNTVCQPAAERHARLYSVVLHFIYV